MEDDVEVSVGDVILGALAANLDDLILVGHNEDGYYIATSTPNSLINIQMLTHGLQAVLNAVVE